MVTKRKPEAELKYVKKRAPEDMDKCCRCYSSLEGSSSKKYCRECGLALGRAYDQKRRAAKEIYKKKWKAENRSRYLEMKKRYWNTPKGIATRTAWAKANAEKVAVNKANGHARRKAAIGEDRITHDGWQWIMRQHGGLCLYCGSVMLPATKDHVIPLSEGGRNIISNIAPACLSCNSSKNSKVGVELERWLMERDVPSEAMIMNDIMVAASERGHRLFRNNVGVARYGKSIVPYGLGVGSPDLIGWTRSGQFIAIEVKVRGKKPKPHQDAWIAAALLSCPGLRIGWADSVERAVEIMENPGL